MVNKNIIEYKDYKGKCLYDERTDKFFKNLEEIEENYEVLPSYMYATYYETALINLEYLLDNLCEEYDITTDSLSGLEDLEKAINLFNDLNKDIKCYYPNMNIKVKLPIGHIGHREGE